MKVSFLLLLVLLSFSCLSQDHDKDYFVERSKALKKTGWILLGSGTVAILTGVIIPRGDLVEEGFWFVPDEYENTNIKTGLILAGSVSTLTSFFLFGSSSRMERKAIQLSLKNEPGKALVNNNISSINIPSVSLRLRL